MLSVTLPTNAVPTNAVPTNAVPAAAPPTSALSTSTLESELVGLAGHLTAAHCRWLQLLAEFDDREGWAGPGLRTCAHWLSWRVGMNLRTAFEQLRVAHALTGLPATTAAFAAGRISYSKVRAITRVATADTEDILVELALAGTASHVERVVRATRQARSDPAHTYAGRRLDWTWDDDGMLRVDARLTPEQGALLISMFDGETDRSSPARSHCSAEHSEVCEHGSGDADRTPAQATPARPGGREADAGKVETDAAQAEPDTLPIEPLAARRADVLISLITRPGSSTAAGSGTAQVVLHIDADKATAHIENGPSIPLASAERIACSARVQALVKDRGGNPLYLGRTHRLVTKKLFAAVSVRDQHRCQWAGCTETRHLDAHHITHWLHGGRSDIHNLVLLCDRHHRLIHDHGYSMRGSGTDATFHRPDGRRIPHAGPPTGGRLEAIYDVSAAHGITVTDEALTPTWGGERLDPTPILALLLPEPRMPAAA